MHKNDSEMVLERLKALFNVSSDSALARLIGATPQTISTWKSRNSVPYAKCVEISEEKNTSLDWLLTGQGEMYRDGSAAPTPTLNSKEQALLELFKELSDKDQREICQDAAEKKRMADLERQVKELALKLERLNSVG